MIYVWVDALLNYITAPGFGTDDPLFERVWPADVQVIGKDITRFHAVIWPALLMAAGLEVPKTILAHGFLYLSGEKMSKSRGNVVHPLELVDRFGSDSYRYFFMREVPFGQDGNYSLEAMVDRHNADLANGLGNLASRVLAMLASNYDGVVPDAGEASEAGSLPDLVADVERRAREALESFGLTSAIATIWEVVTEANRYLVERAPWNLAKDPDRAEELAGVLYASTEVLRILAVLVSPFMPTAAERLWEQLGIAEPLAAQRLPDGARWGGLAPGTKTTKGDALFPRLDE